MDAYTPIYDDSTSLSTSDDSIEGLYMWSNKKIKFLPVNINKSLPNLKAYGANRLSLTIISYSNFKGLFKLKALWLSENEIEIIPDGVFKDLSNIEYLDLRKENEITSSFRFSTISYFQIKIKLHQSTEDFLKN